MNEKAWGVDVAIHSSVSIHDYFLSILNQLRSSW